jgi:hypothetical protein
MQSVWHAFDFCFRDPSLFCPSKTVLECPFFGRYLDKSGHSQRQAERTEDAVKAAAYAWWHFVELMEALPADQAASLWQAMQAQANDGN